ncbi:DUF4232 domain-containing protein [Streptomyces sp. NEAU-H22]|uniref:DUF4232 domain-containing protein n=1 Tax=unclassified Streptomyces TaxID=2593676 RepID=UPI00224D107F|nr:MULTISPECIES: DUF4232 domain-containing protein [unclassified Streptomyces]MCX3287152.1 DUF4232 domain-containing protein [Streptomyces sp. NEAU-H22]WMD03053.1 DUF4232 domain-containing protein [Streptomyces sp. FXY-T5]
MSGNRRKAFLVSAVLVGGALLMTACQDTDKAADTGASQGSPSASGDAATPSGGSSAAGSGKGSGAAGKGAGATGGTEDGAGSGADTGNGKREPVGQSCGANDISWNTRSETQAGGYILISAKAKPGITCVLPAALPTVAFGSDGTEAGPAEQAVGEQITLSGNTTAYAGVNPKSADGDGGKELDSIIVAVGDDDPEPVSLKVGTITVDKPVVTNWHTSATDAVPFG